MAITYGTNSGDTYWDIRGNSDDEKPVEGVPNGSKFTEINTGNEYLFDEASGAWYLRSAGTGGSGGNAAIVDSEMSDTSTNAVQNRVIKNYIDGQLRDYTPTSEIEEKINATVESAVEQSVEQAVDEKLTGATDDDINALFPELYP